MSILRRYFAKEKQTLTSNAPRMVEIVSHEAYAGWQISICNVGDAEDGRIFAPLEVSAKNEKKPSGVYLLPAETLVSFSYENGIAIFKSKELDFFGVYSIIL